MDNPEERKHWAPGIEPISIGQLNLIGVDADRNLYWDGKRLKTEVKLSFWQGAGTVILVLGTLIGGIGAGVQGWASVCQTAPAWAQYMCPAAKRDQVKKAAFEAKVTAAPGSVGIGWATICQKSFSMCLLPRDGIEKGIHQGPRRDPTETVP